MAAFGDQQRLCDVRRAWVGWRDENQNGAPGFFGLIAGSARSPRAAKNAIVQLPMGLLRIDPCALNGRLPLGDLHSRMDI
jgi:uncharacterized protein (DUF169 family)